MVQTPLSPIDSALLPQVPLLNLPSAGVDRAAWLGLPHHVCPRPERDTMVKGWLMLLASPTMGGDMNGKG